MDAFVGCGPPMVRFGEKPGQPAHPFQFHGIRLAETSCGIKTRKKRNTSHPHSETQSLSQNWIKPDITPPRHHHS
ncbi:hypothetical protein VTJ04DRAFT_7874 [Mycothermus thermophilus]|uniref:uncharacterized protein n=1 Tax=Humicola insolens TaxID=85995 RepID=UPI003742F581